MGEILGLGVTHSPPLLAQEGDTASSIRRMMGDPLLPERYRDPGRWPERMRREWGSDEGRTHVERHRAALEDAMRWARKELDAFQPDLVVVFGDDQYENFREDIVPAFCLLGYDADFELQPWKTNGRGGNGGKPNRWGEPGDWALHLHGHREAAKHLATGLIERGMVKSGRLARLRVDVRDVPGALADVATLLGKLGANIDEVQHQRAFSSLSVERPASVKSPLMRTRSSGWTRCMASIRASTRSRRSLPRGPLRPLSMRKPKRSPTT